MKILISTQETQGYRDNDFCFVPEGEIIAIEKRGEIFKRRK